MYLESWLEASSLHSKPFSLRKSLNIFFRKSRRGLIKGGSDRDIPCSPERCAPRSHFRSQVSNWSSAWCAVRMESALISSLSFNASVRRQCLAFSCNPEVSDWKSRVVLRWNSRFRLWLRSRTKRASSSDSSRSPWWKWRICNRQR